MNSHDSQPRLPTWIFIVTDVALIGAAALIGTTSQRPFSAAAMLWMSLCVIVGAVVGLVPIVVAFERQKNETLDERQRALEALARTVHSSAEQISIATGGLHEIAELAQKNLRHAEHLPQKLQEKIAEFQAQLTTTEDAEKEELERELLALRTSESERLDAVSQRIAKSAADWAKLEAGLQQHLAAANESLGKLARGTADAIGKAQAAAEQALTQARTEAARNIGEASGQATRAIETAKTAALTEIDSRFAEAATAAAERAIREITAKLATAAQALDEKIARLEAAAAATPAAHVSSRSAEEAKTPAPSAPVAPTPIVTEAPPALPVSETVSEPAAPPMPKRPRKPRREETAPAAATPPPAPDADSVPAISEPAQTPSAEAEPPPVHVAAVELPPIPAEKIVEIAPVAPHTAEPFGGDIKIADTTPPELAVPAAAAPAAESAPAETPTPAASAAPATAAASTATPRKRTKKSEVPAPPAAESTANDEPALALDLDGGGNSNEPAAIERVLTSDGATRLLVTAYIGIGNRLFIRGAGPGLSWEKGVPLQFVSIGKWRWETSEANAPVQFKLYKNDDVECAALGAQTLEPGHQEEVTAAF